MRLPAIFTLISLLFAAGVISTYPEPNSCTGVCSNIHDPNVVQDHVDMQYYLFYTGGGIHAAVAPSIGGPWTSLGDVLPNGSSIDHRGNTYLWAPDVHFSDYLGLFVMYYAVSTLGIKHSVIGYATSHDLNEGTWTDRGAVLESNSTTPFNCIDPTWHGYQSNVPYMVFGSYFGGIYSTHLAITESGADHIKIQSTGKFERLAWNQTGAIVEGSFTFSWDFDTNKIVDTEKNISISRNTYTYLLFSSGKCCGLPGNASHLPPPGGEYKIAMCRSFSGINGPFLDKDGDNCERGNGGSMLLESSGDMYAPGGQGVIETGNDLALTLYYHYVNTSIGYKNEQFQFGYNYLKFDEDKWPYAI